MPKGNLRCTKSHGTHQYYVNGKYVPKKKHEYAAKIAQREYLEKLTDKISCMLEQIDALKHLYESNTAEAAYDSLCDGRKALIQPGDETVDGRVRKFMDVEYEPKEFDENDHTEHYTMKGERVRSKSEIIIANELFRRGIPYHYEKPLQLEQRGRLITVRPDFTVLNVINGEEYILEHLGMMDDEEYASHSMTKLDLYEKNGYILGKNLIITHETSKAPLSKMVLDAYINEYFVG